MTLRRAIELLGATHTDEMRDLTAAELRNLASLAWMWGELAKGELARIACRPLVMDDADL